MKKIVFVLLAAVLALFAVEWDVEQVTTDSTLSCVNPVITLDHDGEPLILFGEHNAVMGFGFLRLASRESDSWEMRNVANVSDFIATAYSFDILPVGNIVVAFSDKFPGDLADIFLAIDTAGYFERFNLTQDEDYQTWPVIHTDKQGNIQIVYRNSDTTETNEQLYYGWFFNDEFNTDQVTDNLYQGAVTGFDFVMDDLNNPHVFYTAADGDQGLWYAYPYYSAMPGWGLEPTGFSGIWPSAAVDGEGYFHIACSDASPTYLTNQSGEWSQELISNNADDRFACIAIDIESSPYAVWSRDHWPSPTQVFYSGKGPQGWSEPYEFPPIDTNRFITQGGHYFTVDAAGFGHVVYAVEGANHKTQIYYARSSEQIGPAVAEHSTQGAPFDLKVSGTTIRFSLPEQGSISVNLYDACGRLISHLASGNFEAGEHAIHISTTDLSFGVYFVRAEIAERSANAKFVLIR
jgi:hypothetical protein